jgi:hypothetical protein
LRCDDFDTVGELYTENNFRQLDMAVEPAPALFGRFGELEDHGEGGLVRQAALGAHSSVTHCGKRAFDDAGRAQMLPVFGRKVVEGEQRVAILGQAFDRFLAQAVRGVFSGEIVTHAFKYSVGSRDGFRAIQGPKTGMR